MALDRRDFLIHLTGISLNGLGWLGGLLVAYGSVSTWTGKSWEPVEKYAEPVSIGLTIGGCVVTAISIYWYSDKPLPPDHVSRYITAPVGIAAGGVALLLLLSGRSLPSAVVDR